ncbi:MAG: hypothetical protein JWN56_2436 [Sphingobacteriales bacterium]|nr:hypothetical protein [Sphingobacteriales bacterium]
MKTKKLCLSVSFGLANLVLFNSIVFAQETNSKLLDTVVVTATKSDQKQSQTGKVITVISKEQIGRSAGKSVAELLGEQVGIIVNGAGSNPGKDKSLFFRGASSAYTIVLLDGILASNPAFGGAFDFRTISIDQIDHIEILKGGQSTLYGSDAVAGVINIVTKKGGQKGNNISGVLSAGSFNTYKGSLGLNSSVDNFTYNINYTHDRTDGISEASVPPTGSALAFDKDGFKRDALNAAFSLKLDKHLIVSPFVRYSHGKYNYDNDSFSDAGNVSISDRVNAGMQSNLQLNRGKVTLIYDHESNKSEFISTYPGVYQGRMNLIDLFVNHDLSKNLKLLAGIDNRSLQVKSISKESNLFSAYTSLFLSNIGQFNLEAGGRYNQHSEYGDNFTYSVTPSYTFSKVVKLFASISSAFRAPTLDALYGPYGANLSLKPEESKSYEGGVSFNLLDNKFGLRVVGFKRDLTNAIVYSTNGYINQDKQNDKGFEIEPSFKAGKFNANAFYAFVEGKTTSGSNKVDFLLRRPKNSLGLNAGVQAFSNLYFSAAFRSYSSRTDFDFSDYTAVKKVNLDAYNLVDTYAQYTFIKKHVKLFVDLKNILNEKYVEVYGYNTMGFNVNTGISFNIR